MTRSRPRCSTPTQARCHSEADLREAAKLSTSRRQNSVHGGPCSIRSRRRSASRRHLSRPSVSCFTDAEKNASLACASSLIERDCSTSMRKRFISMSSSFSSRRMTGNGSGASQGTMRKPRRSHNAAPLTAPQPVPPPPSSPSPHSRYNQSPRTPASASPRPAAPARCRETSRSRRRRAP